MTLGYCTGFNDAQTNDHTVFVRVVHRVQNFAERTVGDRAQEIEDAAEEVSQ